MFKKVGFSVFWPNLKDRPISLSFSIKSVQLKVVFVVLGQYKTIYEKKTGKKRPHDSWVYEIGRKLKKIVLKYFDVKKFIHCFKVLNLDFCSLKLQKTPGPLKFQKLDLISNLDSGKKFRKTFSRIDFFPKTIFLSLINPLLINF